MDISVIIPVFNEENNLLTLHSQISSVLDNMHREYEVVYVDDGSTDGSFAVLNQIRLKDSRAKVVGFQENYGQTSALDAGFRRSTGNIILTIESDLTYDCNDLVRIIKELESSDIVICYRYNRREADGFIKFISSKIANYVRNKILKENFRDAGCFLRGFRRKCLDNLIIYKGFQVFIVSLLNMQGYQIKEMGIKVYPRKYGISKYGIHNRLWKMLAVLFVIKYMKDNRLNCSLK